MWAHIFRWKSWASKLCFESFVMLRYYLMLRPFTETKVGQVEPLFESGVSVNECTFISQLDTFESIWLIQMHSFSDKPKTQKVSQLAPVFSLSELFYTFPACPKHRRRIVGQCTAVNIRISATNFDNFQTLISVYYVLSTYLKKVIYIYIFMLIYKTI